MINSCARSNEHPSFSARRGRHKISRKFHEYYSFSFDFHWMKSGKKPRLCRLLICYVRTIPIDETKGKRDGNGNEFSVIYPIYIYRRIEGANLLWRGIASQPIFGDFYIAVGREKGTKSTNVTFLSFVCSSDEIHPYWNS